MMMVVSPSQQAWGTTVLRVVVGIVFLVHGLQKVVVSGIPGVAGFMGQLGLPVPLVSAVLVTAAETLGGLALILGLFTRWAALVLAFEMLVAILVVHFPAGFFLPQGFEYPLTLLAATGALALLGAGPASIDGAWVRRAAVSAGH